MLFENFSGSHGQKGGGCHRAAANSTTNSATTLIGCGHNDPRRDRQPTFYQRLRGCCRACGASWRCPKFLLFELTQKSGQKAGLAIHGASHTGPGGHRPPSSAARLSGSLAAGLRRPAPAKGSAHPHLRGYSTLCAGAAWHRFSASVKNGPKTQRHRESGRR